MNLLGLSKVNKYFGERLLFENVSFSIEERDKVGLIGANGTGKTTLIKMILERDTSDGGEIFLSGQTKIGYLEQHIGKHSDKSVYDELLTVFYNVLALEQQMTELTGRIDAKIGDATEHAQLLHLLTEQYEALGGYTYKSMAKSALMGMGFSEDDLRKPFSTLSGGEKMRVCLCKLLLSDANLLLLDEPTNHLDIQSVEWLESFLQGYKGAFIVISHDRYFLDKVTNKTFEIEHGHLNCYNGNYSVFQKQKTENEKYIAKKYQQTMREIARIEGIIQQQKQWNREKNIKTAESKQKMVDRLREDLVIPQGEIEQMRPVFRAKRSGGNDVITATGLSKRFGKQMLFQDVNFLVRRKEHVFLLGKNGCGKTTLLKLMMQQLSADSGEVQIGTNVDIGYFDQTQSMLDEEKTIFDELRDNFPAHTNTQLRNALAGFLFSAEDVFKQIHLLSGGERARLMLLKLMLNESNLLFLDEPTNHLDIPSREILEEALAEYDGTIFAISHDRYFIDKLANRIFIIHDNTIDVLDGNYSSYIEKCMYEKKEIEDASVSKQISSGKEDYLQKKQMQAQQRKQQNQLIKLEQQIEQLEAEIAEIKSELSRPEIAHDYVQCAELTDKLEEKNN
ncbi:MAG: ABC-F family ATP-binding cassette domain-containing protein, partial [Clostridia bacterium]|nr:ABC-F family ATP-binding cassette domain-containing protein [Clostridia bacterium]